MLPEGAWIVVRISLQDAAAGDAVSAHAVQDRFWKTGPFCEFGIGVQRIAVAAEPVDQRLIRARRDVDGLVRAAAPHLVRLGLALGRSAKTAIAARKSRGDQRRQRFALFILEYSLVADHGPL